MYFLCIVLSLLSVCLGDTLEPRATNETCYSGVYIILAPAHLQTGPHLQQPLVQQIKAAIPGSEEYNVPYDTSTENYGYGISQGQMLMTQKVKSYAQDCPQSAIVLMGYSEGGIVMMNTLCGNRKGTMQLSSKYSPNIVAAIAYGEETFVPNQSYDAGNCTGGPSLDPRKNPAGCDRFAVSIQSYCRAEDDRCCNGTSEKAHYEYSKPYDNAATEFVVSRFNAR